MMWTTSFLNNMSFALRYAPCATRALQQAFGPQEGHGALPYIGNTA